MLMVVHKSLFFRNQIPIMAHPPDTSSDLSLDEFLSTILKVTCQICSRNKNSTAFNFKSVLLWQILMCKMLIVI